MADFKQVLNEEEKDAAEVLSQLFLRLSQQERDKCGTSNSRANPHDKLSRGYENMSIMIKLQTKWLKIVGPLVAKHIQPIEIKGNCLMLVADNPVYAQEFIYMKDLVLKNLKEEPELAAITTMKTRIQGEQERKK